MWSSLVSSSSRMVWFQQGVLEVGSNATMMRKLPDKAFVSLFSMFSEIMGFSFREAVLILPYDIKGVVFINGASPGSVIVVVDDPYCTVGEERMMSSLATVWNVTVSFSGSDHFTK